MVWGAWPEPGSTKLEEDRAGGETGGRVGHMDAELCRRESAVKVA